MDISTISIILAFSGGVFMFLAPCTLPLIPAFLASLLPPDKRDSRYELTLRATLFSVGFSVVFIILGFLGGALGSFLAPYRTVLTHGAGLIIVVLALSFFDLYHFKDVLRVRTPLHHRSRIAAFVLGSTFALGWTPCAGPILASILLLGTQSGVSITGGILLAVFSLGLALPFILTGFLYESALRIIPQYERYTRIIRILCGIVLLILGGFLLFGNSSLLTDFGFRIYHMLGIVPICSYY